MPVLHVRALPQDRQKLQRALSVTCRAIAGAYGCEPRQVWATFEELQPGFYVEGDDGADAQPADTHPPICELIGFEGKSAETIEACLLAASRTFSDELGIPGNIFVRYVEAKSGQVVAGDGVLRSR